MTRLSKATLRAIAAHDQEIDPLARQMYGISGAALLAKLVSGESGDNPNSVSSAGARNITQFIKSTRDAVVKKTHGKVDPWRNRDDAIEAAIMHLRGDLGNAKGLAGYNPGMSTYTNYILGQKVGDVRSQIAALGGSSDSPNSETISQPDGGTETVTETSEVVDRDALAQARRRAVLGQMIAKRDPTSPLVKFGVLNPVEPDPAAFTTTQTTERTVRSDGGSDEQPDGAGNHPSRGDLPGPLGGTLNELFYNGPGGVNVDESKRVGKGFVSGHTDHVHVAAGQRSIQTIAKIAQQMGLHVGELAPFDKVDPVHTDGSFHYRKRAADVSGDPKKMAAFNRRIARLYGIGA